jgi:C-terminal processing protease CtpA/Prc
MLSDISGDVKKHYYDSKLHGFDLNARIQEAQPRIRNAKSMDEALSIVAWVFDGLDDSHTFFLPPPRTLRVDYGWQMQLVGNRAYTLAVKPKSDAEAKGLKPGDEIVAVNGYPPVRELFWKMKYLYQVLRPQPALDLQVRTLDGKERTLQVMSRMWEKGHHVVDFTSGGGADLWDIVREMENFKEMMRPRSEDMSSKLMILKLPQFMLSNSDVDSFVGKARGHATAILDLRGNPGGSVDTLEHMLGNFFDHDVKIADRIGRQSLKPLEARSVGGGAFAGKLIVLVDSQSASAAELFARTVQLEKRGIVLGDRTAGSVMEAKRYSYRVGLGSVVFFGAQITEADLIMSDGKSLEHTGVTPDEIILPTGKDLNEARDPALSRAAEMAGIALSPEQAGKLFPFEWPKE